MPNDELINFIKQSRAAGQTNEQIMSALKKAGWQDIDIEDSFESQKSQLKGSSESFSGGLNGQNKINFSEKKSGKWKYIIVIIILFLFAGGAGAYYFRDKLSDLPVIKNFILKLENTSPTSEQNNSGQNSQNLPVSSPKSEDTNKTITPKPSQPSATICDNYDCLISAAEKCSPITATVSYSELPFPLGDGLLVSGKTKYEIKSSSGENKCTLIITPIESTMTITEQDRQEAISKGTTDAQIAAQLDAMNNNLKLTVASGTQTICPSNASAITDYLKDSKEGNFKFETNFQTVTYSTSTGKKLVCTTQSSK